MTEAWDVPITRLLAGADFAPEALEVMQQAYDGVVEALKLTDAEAKNEAAALVIKLAAPRSILDVDELRDDVIVAMQGKAPPAAA